MAAQNSLNINPPNSPVLKEISENTSLVKNTLLPAFVILLVVLAGIGTGWFASRGGVEIEKKGTTAAPGAQIEEGGKVVGLNDTRTFRDKAEGVLENGGIDGEGTHHLVREGGPSQNVYLTSSVVDLDQFVGKKVEVWGETNKGIKAGWLMDVGKIKVLE